MLSSFSLEECLTAYVQVGASFGYKPVIQPGKTQLFGWELEYVCGPALANFIDQILVRRLDDFLPDNDHPVILDCGSNIGFGVLNYKRQFPKSRIVAFEPDPQFAPVLRRNLSRNGAGDVRIVEAAVWINNGKSQWFCEGIDGSKLIADGQMVQNTVVVRTIDFADYIVSEIDLIKLDIEGAEYEVVSHLAAKGKLHLVKNMIIECHVDQVKIKPLGQMLEALHSAGFQIGINSMGQWRDLIRQPEISPNHYGQYLTVATWRKPIASGATIDRPYLPYMGIGLLFEEQRLEQTQNELCNTRNDLLSAQDGLQSTLGELQSIQGELQATQNELQSKQNELLYTRGELQSTQNQLLSTRTELQSTHNELQSTRSELQSTQNELISAQAVLQSTQNELQSTRDELQSTQNELQGYTRLGRLFRGTVHLINILLDWLKKRT